MSGPLTIKEAAKCKSCDKVGKLIISQRIKSPSNNKVMDVAVYECPEPLCLKSGPNHRWIVQSDLEGFVYERGHGIRGHDKEFPEKSAEQQSKGRQHLENLLESEYTETDQD